MNVMPPASKTQPIDHGDFQSSLVPEEFLELCESDIHFGSFPSHLLKIVMSGALQIIGSWSQLGLSIEQIVQ